MVGVAQLVEHLVVVQDAAGSSPVTHPTSQGRLAAETWRGASLHVRGQASGGSAGMTADTGIPGNGRRSPILRKLQDS